MNLQKPNAGIEWTHVPGYIGATANPVRGCEHACRWRMPDGDIALCYAEALANRIQKMRPQPGRPYEHGFSHLTFHPDELAAIARKPKPHALFIDSMSDLFGSRVNADWICQTLQCAVENPRHLFISLTKNPGRLARFAPYPDNWWLGVSAPPTFMFGRELSLHQQRTWFWNALKHLADCEAAVRWVSLEPLSFDPSDLLRDFRPRLDWAVIGAASNGARKFQPDREIFQRTHDALRARGTRIFLKGNIDRALAADVCGRWLAEFPEPRGRG